MALSKIQIMAMAELELRRRRAAEESRRIHYQTHPVDYMSERLGISPEKIDYTLIPEYQNHKWDGTPNPFKTILDSLAEGNWTGVESATGTGKTFLGAAIMFWFLECFPGSMVVTTAPKEDQLKYHIWKEAGKMYSKFGRGQLGVLKLRMKEDREDWIAIGFTAGIKANEESSTKAQGFHAEHMLIIFEETPGIPEPVITAFQNTSVSTHNLILAFGNPDHQLDNLHKFCKLPNVKHIRISAFDHPNVVLDNPGFIPGATSRAGLLRMEAKYHGKENPFYMSRARGISPAQGQDSLIMLEWCYAARDRGRAFQDDMGKFKENLIVGNPALGVDVANSEFGDKAALARGKGPVLLEVKDFQCPDANQLGKRDVYRLYKEHKIEANNIGIDAVGVGAGTVNALKELDVKAQALSGADAPVYSSKAAEEFNNLRSQMYWQLREDLRNNEIILPDDEELFADLVTPKWQTKNGKIVIESKEDIKKRLGHSPNKGDAAVYWNWVRRARKSTGITVYNL